MSSSTMQVRPPAHLILSLLINEAWQGVLGYMHLGGAACTPFKTSTIQSDTHMVQYMCTHKSTQQTVSHLAGVQATGPLVEQSIEYFQQVMDTNLTGAVRMTQAIVPAMLARVSPHSSLSP